MKGIGETFMKENVPICDVKTFLLSVLSHSRNDQDKGKSKKWNGNKIRLTFR